MTDCCELLIAEHRRVEDLLERLEQLLRPRLADADLSTSVLSEAQTLYRVLAADLHRHYAIEEKALFPVLSQYRTMMLMEAEHDDLLGLQHAFARQLERLILDETDQSDDRLNLFQQFEVFKTRLLAHVLEEERGIFPLANERLEPEEKMKVLRLTNALVEVDDPSAYDLFRPEPGFILKRANLSSHAQRPMEYETLFEREHHAIQTLRLQAGQKQAMHWSGQTQVMVVLLGELRFECLEAEGVKTLALSMGDTLTIDSRLLFSLSAVTDALLMVFKVWPRPHYAKS